MIIGARSVCLDQWHDGELTIAIELDSPVQKSFGRGTLTQVDALLAGEDAVAIAPGGVGWL